MSISYEVKVTVADGRWQLPHPTPPPTPQNNRPLKLSNEIWTPNAATCFLFPSPIN